MLTTLILINSYNFAFSYEIKINPIYDEVRVFLNELAPVKINNRWGYINKKGELVIPAKFEKVSHFNDDIARVQIETGEGFINKNGDFVIPPIFEKQKFIGGGFSGSLAKVKQNGKYGFINRKGKQIIPFIYDAASDFDTSETAIVTFNKYSGIIDQQGNFILPLMYRYLMHIKNGLYQITPNYSFEEKSVKYINSSGKIILELNEEKKCSWSFRQGLCPSYDLKLKKYGYINENAEIIINPMFEEADPFENGLAKVTIGNDGKKTIGYIDRTGKFVLPAIYEDGTFLPSPDLVEVKFGNWGIVNLKGEFIVPPNFDDLLVSPDSDNYIGFKENGKWGFLTLE